MKKAKPRLPKNKLPKVFRVSDLSYPTDAQWLGWKILAGLRERGVSGSITLYHVINTGWCAPVLLIQKAGRRHSQGTADRNYAVCLNDGKIYRIGLGPHVDEKAVFHLKKGNLKRLASIIETISAGAVQANQIRDQRSTRAMRRFF